MSLWFTPCWRHDTTCSNVPAQLLFNNSFKLCQLAQLGKDKIKACTSLKQLQHRLNDMDSFSSYLAVIARELHSRLRKKLSARLIGCCFVAFSQHSQSMLLFCIHSNAVFLLLKFCACKLMQVTLKKMQRRLSTPRTPKVWTRLCQNGPWRNGVAEKGGQFDRRKRVRIRVSRSRCTST